MVSLWGFLVGKSFFGTLHVAGGRFTQQAIFLGVYDGLQCEGGNQRTTHTCMQEVLLSFFKPIMVSLCFSLGQKETFGYMSLAADLPTFCKLSIFCELDVYNLVLLIENLNRPIACDVTLSKRRQIIGQQLLFSMPKNVRANSVYLQRFALCKVELPTQYRTRLQTIHVILGINSLLRMFVYSHVSTLRVLQGIYRLKGLTYTYNVQSTYKSCSGF